MTSSAHGQVETVKLFRGAMVLDGRNRYTACARKNIGVRTEVFTGTDREALLGRLQQEPEAAASQRADRARIAARMPN
jgi:hypothetical protein